jgi:ParB-like chromosome segregation protein Spo0J
MESLKTVGLIHPIVVTDDLTLVAGARRLEATKRLGGTMIEVRRVGELPEQERAIIELEENLHRKNLTPVERSQTTALLAEAVGAQLREQEKTQETQGVEPNHDRDMSTPTPVNPGQNEFPPADMEQPKRRGGRQKMPDSQGSVAAEMGVAVSTITDAQKHLAAVERYPELGAPDVSQREAIRLAKTWDAMKPSNRSRARKAWNANRQAKQDRAEGKSRKARAPKSTPKAKTSRAKGGQPATVSAQVRLTRTWYTFTAGLLQLINDFEHSGGTAPLLAYWTPEELARAQAQLGERLTQLERIRRELDEGTATGVQAGALRVIHGQEG